MCISGREGCVNECRIAESLIKSPLELCVGRTIGQLAYCFAMTCRSESSDVVALRQSSLLFQDSGSRVSIRNRHCNFPADPSSALRVQGFAKLGKFYASALRISH